MRASALRWRVRVSWAGLLASTAIGLLGAACASPPRDPGALGPPTVGSTDVIPLPTEGAPPLTDGEPTLPPAPGAPAGPPPIGGDAGRVLAVPGFADAVIHVPVAATNRRPVLVATHGNYDTPDYQCHVWGQIVRDRGFVLCPRGVRRPDSPSKDDPRFEYASNFALEKELDAGLAALRASFPEHVADGPVVFTGFSLGAIMGVSIASRRPELFGGLVLIEGGDKWSLAGAKKLAPAKARVLFACSQPSCSSNARVALGILTRAGVDAALVSGKNEGHTYGGSVRVAYAARFPWVVEPDPRWRAP